MRVRGGRILWTGVAICILYVLTWAVAEMTLAAHLKRNAFDEWEAFAKEKRPATPAAELHAQVPKWAEESRFLIHVTRVVPLLPGVVLAWHDDSASFQPGGTHGYYAGHRSVFLVYLLGSKALYSKTIEVAP